MEDLIKISQLNDFIFCPVSIYFHNLYGEMETRLYQNTDQINGKSAHDTVDTNRYSTKRSIITSLDVYCEKYGLIGKIDIYDIDKKNLIERKKKIVKIYDGYIFQLYAQYFSLIEMGYEVEQLRFHSMDDNKQYDVPLPKANAQMLGKFEKTIRDIKTFSVDGFDQQNAEKCKRCIYESACDRSAYDFSERL